MVECQTGRLAWTRVCGECGYALVLEGRVADMDSDLMEIVAAVRDEHQKAVL